MVESLVRVAAGNLVSDETIGKRAGARASRGLWLADDAAVAPRFLCLVKRAVRAVKGGIGAVFGDEVGDPAGGGDGHRVVAKVESELRDFHADLVGDGVRLGRRGTDAQRDKFLAAVARHEVGLAHVLFEQLAENSQYLVAGSMSIGVVDLLEVVDVPGEDAHRAAEALPASEFLLYAHIVGGAVRNGGERIHHCQPLSLLKSDMQAVAFALELPDARTHTADALAIGFDARFLAPAKLVEVAVDGTEPQAHLVAHRRQVERAHDVGLELLDFTAPQKIEIFRVVARRILLLDSAGQLRSDLIEPRSHLLQQVFELELFPLCGGALLARQAR